MKRREAWEQHHHHHELSLPNPPKVDFGDVKVDYGGVNPGRSAKSLQLLELLIRETTLFGRP